MNELLKLAERCEREGSSWQLDIAIGEALFGCKYGTAGAPRFSSSLDAAVTLVPENMSWFMEINNDTAFASLNANRWSAYAKAGAVALCAALRARAALAGGDGCGSSAPAERVATSSGDSNA